MDVVKNEWDKSSFLRSPSFIFMLKLKALKGVLKSWSRSKFGTFNAFKKDCLDRIMAIDDMEEVRALSVEERELRGILKMDFQKESLKEEVFWRQRSRINWLKEGDRNTKFFHKVASDRKFHNQIKGLMIDSNWVEDREVIKLEIPNYFAHLYKEDCAFRPYLDGLEFDFISSLDLESLERPLGEWKFELC